MTAKFTNTIPLTHSTIALLVFP